jgi:hypothetical protein
LSKRKSQAERPQTLRRINSASSYGESFQGYIKKENKTAKKSLKKYHNRGSEGDVHFVFNKVLLP